MDFFKLNNYVLQFIKMNTPKNQPTKAINQAPQRIFAKGAGSGQMRPEDPYDGEGEELSSVKRVLFPDLSVDTTSIPAGPPFRRTGHVEEVVGPDGRITTQEVLIDTTDRMPSVQRTVSSHGIESYPTNLAHPLSYLEGEFDAPLPLHYTASNQGIPGRWVYWRQLPNSKFVWDPQWVSEEDTEKDEESEHK